eukprot:g3490.t1
MGQKGSKISTSDAANRGYEDTIEILEHLLLVQRFIENDGYQKFRRSQSGTYYSPVESLEQLTRLNDITVTEAIDLLGGMVTRNVVGDIAETWHILRVIKLLVLHEDKYTKQGEAVKVAHGIRKSGTIDKSIGNWLHDRVGLEIEKNRTPDVVPRSAHFQKRRESFVMRVGLEYRLSEQILLYNFDIFSATDSTGYENILPVIGSLIFSLLSVDSKLKISLESITAALKTISGGYDESNSYHNAIHAADVLQTASAMIFTSGISEKLHLRKVYVTLMACAMHDYDHPGVSNMFLIATEDDIAIKYNDISVLENHHVASAYKALKDDNIDIFISFEKEKRQKYKKLLVSLVLSTDLANHFTFLGNMDKIIDNHQSYDWKSEEKTTNYLCLVMKAADVSNPSKAFPIYVRWTNAILEEFYCQGDREKHLNLPVSPFCDRGNAKVTKCQLGFLNFIVNPLFQKLSAFSPGRFDFALMNLDKLTQRWSSRELIEEEEGRTNNTMIFIPSREDEVGKLSAPITKACIDEQRNNDRDIPPLNNLSTDTSSTDTTDTSSTDTDEFIVKPNI